MSQSRILLEVGTNELEIVEFYIDEPDGYRGYYGINVSKVIEISRSQPVTAMPQMRHPSVLGAFPFRGGRIVPLIDVSKFLDKGGITSKDPRVIVTEFNKAQMAFLVSGVTRIHRISWKQVEAPSPFLLKMSRGSITAVVRLEGHMLFLLDVEAIVAAMDPSLSVRMDEERKTPPPARKYHIIHADDSANIRRLVFDELEKEGRFDISQATDGEEAWKMLQQCKAEAEEKGVPVTDIVQGVISDIEMPNLDGLTLCRYIKEDPVLKVIPVAMFSSLISEPLARKCQSVGADAQFAKPDLQAISDKMYALIQTSQAKNQG
ncbi:MAG TPA: chemotaxis protein [Candidatus Mailhella merdavium]|nr:chemotaxis protein [Candidatus Mailhella merdavium]